MFDPRQARRSAQDTGCVYDAQVSEHQSVHDDPQNQCVDLIALAERIEAVAPIVRRLWGSRVVKVDPSDPIAVSQAHAAIADRYDAWTRNKRPAPIHWMAAKRIRELERYLQHRYGIVVPDDDAGCEDLVILLNHVAQNRHDPRGWVLACIQRWAPWMESTKVADLADMILIRPRKYKATTLGRLLRLTQYEQTTLEIVTIRPFDVTDADLHAKAKQKDRERKRDKRATNSSGRRPGRPKSKDAKRWDVLGVSKASYYRHQKRQGRRETKNPSEVLEETSNRSDAISVSPGLAGSRSASSATASTTNWTTLRKSNISRMAAAPLALRRQAQFPQRDHEQH